MLGLAWILIVTSAWAGDPCAGIAPAYDGDPSAVVRGLTAFDPVGDLVDVRVGLVRPIRLTVDMSLPADHPTVRERRLGFELLLDDGALLALDEVAGGPAGVELQAALVPGMVQVDVPLGATLSTDQVAVLAARRVTGIRLMAEPDHVWTLKAGASRKLRAAFACAAAR